MDQAQALRNVIKLRNQNLVNTARVITVTSGKGGVGKSNCAVNLAIQLAKEGKKVIIFDADFGLANVEVMFGAIPKYNLSDIIYNGKNIKDIITPGPLGIGFISAGSGVLNLNNLYHEQIQYLVNCLGQLNELCDFIIIDTGAGVSEQVLAFVMMSPEVLMVTTPEPSSLTDAYSLLKALYRNPGFSTENTVINVLANKVTSREEGNAVYEKLNSVVSKFLDGNLKYLGMIPMDMNLEKSVRAQKTVSLNVPNAASTKAFELLAHNILYGEQKNNVKFGISQMFTNYFYRGR